MTATIGFTNDQGLSAQSAVVMSFPFGFQAGVIILDIILDILS